MAEVIRSESDVDNKKTGTNEYRIIIGLNTYEIENDIDALVFRHVDTFSWIVRQKVEVTVIDSDDETVKAIVDDLFDHIIGSVSCIHAFRVIHDPADDRWQLVHERHVKESE